MEGWSKARTIEVRYKPCQLPTSSLFLLATVAVVGYRYATFQLGEPWNKIPELILDLFAFLLMDESASVNGVGLDKKSHFVVFDERINTPQTRFERQESIGRLLRDVQQHLRHIDEPSLLRYGKTVSFVRR